MAEFIRKFINDKKGLNTVEIVVLVAIAIGLALIFKDQITQFVKTILDNILDTSAFKISPTPTP
jgi:Flp pilus assembly pilin Flp